MEKENERKLKISSWGGVCYLTSDLEHQPNWVSKAIRRSTRIPEETLSATN